MNHGNSFCATCVRNYEPMSPETRQAFLAGIESKRVADLGLRDDRGRDH